MTQPRITIVTPNYNNGRFLERAICSVLDQEYRNLEYFVIDGGSTDQSVDIIRLYERELAGWVSEPDAGPSEAINKGLSRATGDIVAYLNSDDVYLPGALIDVARRMTAADAPSWVVGQCKQIDAADYKKGLLVARAPQSMLSYLMHDSGNLPGVAGFWGRRLIQKHGLFDGRMRRGFDYEYNCRLLTAGESPAVIPQAVVALRDLSRTHNAAATVQCGLEYIAAARRYADRLPLTQRYALWVNCDVRRRIYALAEAEIHAPESRWFLWHQLVRHPWWIANDAVRSALLRGVGGQPLQTAPRAAA